MWEYVKGSEADFIGAPEWATVVSKSSLGRLAFEEDSKSVRGNRWMYLSDKLVLRYETCTGSTFKNIIAQRRKVDDLQSRINDEKLAHSAGYVTWDEFNQTEAKKIIESFDTVQRPAHYNQSGIECIDAIAASMSAEEFQAYLKGNVQKYLWRYQHKNGLEDVRKAQWYLDRLVKELSK